jgi:hypothetical protein
LGSGKDFHASMRVLADTHGRNRTVPRKKYNMPNLINKQIEYTRALMPLSGQVKDRLRPTLQAAAVFKDGTLPNKTKKVGGMRLRKLLLDHPLSQVQHSRKYRSSRYRYTSALKCCMFMLMYIYTCV